jgi:hypothetical protein
MEGLMRFFILFILTFFAAEAEDSLLQNTHIRMIPKIMALDTRLSAKTVCCFRAGKDSGWPLLAPC